MHIRMVIQVLLEVPEVVIDRWVWRCAQEHELETMFERVKDGVVNQISTLLLVDPPDACDDWLELVSQPQTVA